MLDSTIATTSNFTLLRQFVSRPVEVVWEYDKLKSPFATELYKSMKKDFGDIGSLEGVFRSAWTASSELGSWCSDRIWIHALGEDVIPRLEGKITKCLSPYTSSQISENANAEIARVREASDIVSRYSFSNPNTPGELSPKVQLLRKELSNRFCHSTDSKCIVFTQKRYTAKILHELFTALDIPFLRPGVLVGVRSGDIMGMNSSFRQQFVSLIKFRKGEINCLVRDQIKFVRCVADDLKFATSVAEEGLDIPDCNLVVRYVTQSRLVEGIC